MQQEQPRETSGRFGAKTTPVKVPTPASDKIARIKARRQCEAPHEFLIPPPRPMEQLNRLVLNRANPYGIEDGTRERLAEMTGLEAELKGWFKAIADHPDATYNDLWKAWTAWHPGGMRRSTLRWNFVEDLLHKLGKRRDELYRQAELEQQPDKIRRECQTRLAAERKKLEEAQEAYDKVKAEYDRVEAAVGQQLAAVDAMEAERLETEAA